MGDSHAKDGAAPRTVLFLCTGNYYRSRFAEELFNALAREQRLPWQADSRALIDGLERLVQNVGPVSPHVVRALQGLGYPPVRHERYPCALVASELAVFERVIAVYEREHRPMVQARFADHAGRIEYWSVPDVDELDPARALRALERQVRELLGECRDEASRWR